MSLTVNTQHVTSLYGSTQKVVHFLELNKEMIGVLTRLKKLMLVLGLKESMMVLRPRQGNLRQVFR